VPYEDVEVSKAIAVKKKGKQMQAQERQLVLPFEITAPVSSEDLVLKLLPQGVRRYRLQLTVGISR
jgi:hypothetical protein